VISRAISKAKSNNKFVILFFTVNLLFVFSFFVAPVQDDYSVLSQVSSMGMRDFIQWHWNFHGGNIVPMALSSISLITAIDSFNFISLKLYVLTTFIILIFSIRFYLLSKFQSKNADVIQLSYFIIAGTIFGFEGIFTPGFLGAYSFSLASLVHLWPVCFFLVGVVLCGHANKHWVILLTLGFLAGNSNIAESVAFISTLLVILIIKRKNKLIVINMSNLSRFVLGILLGTIMIIASPGFWIRAQYKVEGGIPSTFSSFISKVLQSTVFFTADILTHPVLYIFLIIGVFFGARYKVNSDYFKDHRAAEILFASLFFTLIIGSAFAYPAWHQSLGLLSLLPYVSFKIGVKFSEFIPTGNVRFLKRFLVFLLLLLFSLTIRSGYLHLDRVLSWNESNNMNVCALRYDTKSAISFTEILYPPFRLGIEEVQSWQWIKDSYLDWIKTNNSSQNIEC
jgi:hypothetical protein